MKHSIIVMRKGERQFCLDFSHKEFCFGFHIHVHIVDLQKGTFSPGECICFVIELF